MLFLMAYHDVSIGNPCDAGFVLSEPSLYTYSLTVLFFSYIDTQDFLTFL